MPFEEQSKFYQLVEEENTKTIEVLKAQQSALEKGAELALGAAHLLAKEEALNQSSSKQNFAKKTAKSNPNGSPIPVPNPIAVQLENGVKVTYKSNSKHTKGMPGNRPDAGIEPRDSLELFKKSIELNQIK
ncbi:hypothetical protein [Histophilus somni]|uniref:hypothetical protein n=1 Tax=Histophilus somni TaxID=731 RepID=UPI0011C25476|nr:hypothetical protein [Histophilus somni]QEH18191.1 hypothetical protein FWK48_06255 [Histophilus somni]